MNIVDKVHKLLRLSTSSNPHEAALAADRAQKLIYEHNLTESMLSFENQTEPDELIVDFGELEQPLDESGHLQIRWKGVLSVVLSKLNGCHVYKDGRTLHIIGRPSDVETVRYMFGYLCRETMRLTRLAGKGMTLTWKRHHSLGIVDTLSTRLEATKQEFEHDKRQLIGRDTTALVLMNKALMQIDKRAEEAKQFLYQTHSDMRPGKRSRPRLNLGARAAGRRAGYSIKIGSAKRALSGQKGLTS